MKKSIFNIASGAILFLANTTFVQAQKDKPEFNISNSKNLEQVVALSSASGAGSASSLNKRAVREFNKQFASVSNVTWSNIMDGFLATFHQDGSLTRAYFDRKGNPTYTVKSYDESHLDRDIRRQVKSVYFDSKITGIEEIKGGEKTVYIIHLEDETTWKKIRLEDGAMEVMEDFRKG